MYSLVLFLLITLLGNQVSGYLFDIPKYVVQPRLATSDAIHTEKLILALFGNTCDDSIDPTIVRLSNEFTFESSIDSYMNPEVVTNLQNILNGKGLLPKGMIFSEFDEDNLKELKSIYDVLLNAQNFDTFYKAAAWARQNVNCAVFIDAIYAALLHRRDTEKIAIPAPYELLPNYFIKKDSIIKGTMLTAGDITPSDDIHAEGNTYTIDTNYTSDYIENQEESKLAYFMEDVGLNSYYFLKKLLLMTWNKSAEIPRRGEYWYHHMKQLISRYNLERYANGFQDVEDFSLDDITNSKYDPMLIYSNGYDFPARVQPVDVKNKPEYIHMQNIENNIAVIASHMMQNGYTKAEIFNNLMDILVTEETNYESAALHLFVNNIEQNNQVPLALGHYMTLLRDPVYWQICKKIIALVDKSVSILPSYGRNELYFPGVQVSDILVKKMVTYCDLYEIDVTDALESNQSQSSLQIKFEQPRLNHKPFAIKINIASLVSQKALIKIYLTPKILPTELADKKNNFFLLDVFEYNLVMGTNLIARTSDQIKSLSNDFMSIKSLLKSVENAEFDLETLPLKEVESHASFPGRLVLPKGASSGLPFQIFVLVAPIVKVNTGDLHSMELNTAILSPGYPFDSNIDTNLLFDLPNTMFKEIIITHKGDNKVSKYGGTGDSKKWGGSTYDPSSRPIYDYSNKKQGSFDYSSKKGQYGKKYEFNTPEQSTNVNVELETKPKVEDDLQENAKDNKVDLETVPRNLIENIDINMISKLPKPGQASKLIAKKPLSVFDYIYQILYNGEDDDAYDRSYE